MATKVNKLLGLFFRDLSSPLAFHCFPLTIDPPTQGLGLKVKAQRRQVLKERMVSVAEQIK